MKILFTLLTLTLSVGVFAQDFSGKATYQTKMIIKDFEQKAREGDEKSILNDELLKQMKDALNKASEKTFFLEFTKEESLYTEEEKLAPPTTGSSNISISFSSSSSGTLYKNLKENYSILESNYLDKPFLIKDSLHTSGWELSTDTKQIGNYTAYKATKTVKAKNIALDDEKENDNSSDLLSMIDKEPKDLVYTAWYTPQIPIANGPEKFGGLPGLILELHTPNMVYLCSEIVLNPKKAIAIKAPKGKTTSQEEFDKIMKKRMDEMKKSSKSKSRNGTTIIQTFSIGG